MKDHVVALWQLELGDSHEHHNNEHNSQKNRHQPQHSPLYLSLLLVSAGKDFRQIFCRQALLSAVRKSSNKKRQRA